jgi:hypothetical protein
MLGKGLVALRSIARAKIEKKSDNGPCGVFPTSKL